MLATHDYRGLTRNVEPWLKKDLMEDLNEMVSNDIELEIENEDDHSMRIDILDYAYHINADINWSNNANNRLWPFSMDSVISKQAKRHKIYANEDLNIGKSMYFNVEVLVRFITNLKLNPVHKPDDGE